jgi:hypothetical protein
MKPVHEDDDMCLDTVKCMDVEFCLHPEYRLPVMIVPLVHRDLVRLDDKECIASVQNHPIRNNPSLIIHTCGLNEITAALKLQDDSPQAFLLSIGILLQQIGCRIEPSESALFLKSII